MPRVGVAYERWVRTQTARICEAMGLAADGMRVRREVTFRGGRNYVVDVWAESHSDLVLIECKDTRVTQQDLVYHRQRVLDIAHARPDKDVYGVILTTRLPSPSWPHVVAPDSTVNTPANVAGPIDVLVSPPRLAAGHVLLWRLSGTDTEAIVIRRGRACADPVELENGLEHARMGERLVAALGVLALPEAGANLTLKARTEASIALVHMGSGIDAYGMARLAAKAAHDTSSRHHTQYAKVFQALAEYRATVEVTPPGRVAGRQAAKRLTNDLDTLDPYYRSSALQFLGPWHARHGDRVKGERLLLASLALAEDVVDAEYFHFIGRFRLAEMAEPQELDEKLAAATDLLPMLSPKHRELSDSLLARITNGEDTSIGSRLPLEQPMLSAARGRPRRPVQSGSGSRRPGSPGRGRSGR
jgi:hypothetical protein